MASIKQRPNGQWRARYRDESNKEISRHFPRKTDAQRWLDEITASVVTGSYIDPVTAKTTVSEWCDQWIAGYAINRESSVRAAKTHLTQIEAEFGPMALGVVRPSHVKQWIARLKRDGYADSYVYALYRRLSQVMSDAVADGIVARNPCSKKNAPAGSKQRAYVATTEQVWALHDAVRDEYKAGILLGAFAGLRIAETCGLRVSDVDYMRGIVSPSVQWPELPLKTEKSYSPIPIPSDLALELAAHVKARPGMWQMSDLTGKQTPPWALEREIRRVRTTIEDLPEGFRYHDLRHYFASLLIASGADVKVVQARLRHASAMTTLDTYGHLWPDADESTRAAVSVVFAARADSLRTSQSS